MADTTSTPTPTTPKAATPDKKGADRGEINKAHLKEISTSRKVAAAARAPENTAKLTEVELDPTLVDQIEALASKVETDLGAVHGTRVVKKVMTVQEKTARTLLIGELQTIQTAAKRKFAGDSEKLREAYYIGARLSGKSLDEVLAAVRSVLARLVKGEGNKPPLDTLPGITTAGAIKKLSDAITLYGDYDVAQDKEEKKAFASIEEIESNVIKLAGLRRDLQLAADQAWPWRNQGVTTIRKTFLLPTTRPLKD